jgi:Flp pilus assembly protein TadG
MNRTFLSTFARNQGGAAAIELAMVTPIIAGLAVVSFGVWERGSMRQDARAALDVSVQYFMNGGTDDATARTLGQQGWRNRPSDGAIASARSYKCGTTPAADAAVICAGGRTPATYVTLTATGTDAQTLGNNPTQVSLQRTVRVR